MYYTIPVGTLALLATVASAETITVEVGKDHELTFSPDSIKANTGDIVEFHFNNARHDVIAGDFQNPCHPADPAASGGFYSGDRRNGTFCITVNNTDPVFFYCSVGRHCQNGMVGVINEGSNKLDDFKSAAANVGASRKPMVPFGGSDCPSKFVDWELKV
ncbi:plastocyanin-like domain protein [Metarhizium robertsii]|uniref:Extracellular serine-rich protein n=2 Tax=Metarhizium robertsii TaxID=568076 RepID=E9F5N2_METRA|nr:extracellular serine-rich protein [Metarhizium robertsii ARSEF 23]EFY97035.1 extracellular serine-rich protein [Metarhizium robertsii ARSEF 23]EXU99359.1 plastocyanin-like domain protein [Metarhizium robertsii]